MRSVDVVDGNYNGCYRLLPSEDCLEFREANRSHHFGDPCNNMARGAIAQSIDRSGAHCPQVARPSDDVATLQEPLR